MRVIRPLLCELDRVLALLRQADRVLIALDFDGTLAPMVDDPKIAAIPPKTIETLTKLSCSPRYSLAVVSGRSLADLEGRAPAGAICVGNHGLEIRGGGISYVREGAEMARTAIDHACWDLEAALGGVRGMAVERKDLTATVHYRNAPAELVGWLRATVEEMIRPYLSKLYIAPALQALEIRPRIHWNKGSAVRYLLDRMETAGTALITAGDDTTDEDMFGLLRQQVSIKVGTPRCTRAQYYVRGVTELAEFLAMLASGENSGLPSSEVTVLSCSSSSLSPYR